MSKLLIQGEYVVGIKVKSEGFQGNAAFGSLFWNNKYDDSAYNAIRLQCSDGEELVSAEGAEGHWSKLYTTKYSTHW